MPGKGSRATLGGGGAAARAAGRIRAERWARERRGPGDRRGRSVLGRGGGQGPRQGGEHCRHSSPFGVWN